MISFTDIGKTEDFADGSMKTVIVEGKKVAIIRVGEEFFAVSDTCTHEQCSLGSEGYLNEKTITCGCHGAQFDATNGKVLTLPAVVDLLTYVVKVEKGEVYIGA